MSLSKAVGGYFELELGKGSEFHPEAIRLNTGRNALEYILRARKYRKIYLPYYTCHVLLQPVNKLGLEVEYYRIDERLEPEFDFSMVKAEEAFLYTNYYGLKDDYMDQIKGAIPNLIFDNAQAFYSKPHAGVDTFYSARKFFGVPDGAYLYTDQPLNEDFEQDRSYERCAHLLIRVDESAERGYPFFVEADESLDNNPIRHMSRLTQQLLRSIDYESAAEIRRANGAYLHEALKDYNLLRLSPDSEAVPLAYPFLTDNAELRSKLISERVYVARYWQEVLDLVAPGSLEYRFAQGLLPLPIDQRVTRNELDHIINLIQYAHQG